MLSKAQIQYINSLQQKKFRKQHNAFIVEGLKSVEEFLLSGYSVLQIFCTAAQNTKMPKIPHKIKLYEVSDEEFMKISSLTTPQGILAIVEIPENGENQKETFTRISQEGSLILGLDEVQDPGNLGTIIRIADWYGIKHIIASKGTADTYNSKTVQASMGSLSRVKVHYVDIANFIEETQIPVYGALLNGESIYETTFKENCLILLGNEGNGIGSDLVKMIETPVSIPSFGGAESLNVGVATAIFCSEYKRQQLKK